MTAAVKAAIVQADVVIGYSLYIELIAVLLRPGQIMETPPIPQEQQQAERAIALANWVYQLRLCHPAIAVFTALAEFVHYPIDRLTTVLIGN